MKAWSGLPLCVRSMEGLGVGLCTRDRSMNDKRQDAKRENAAADYAEEGDHCLTSNLEPERQERSLIETGPVFRRKRHDRDGCEQAEKAANHERPNEALFLFRSDLHGAYD